MRVVIQRVSKASVAIDDKIKASIDTGLLLLLGIEPADTTQDAEWLSRKIVQMRIFTDENGLMNKSLLDVNGDIILISQFTLHASAKKGNRPSFTGAAKPEIAIPLYEDMIEKLKGHLGKDVHTGSFGAYMEVSLTNDGPVTIILDSKNRE